jgi:hypothetical protein
MLLADGRLDLDLSNVVGPFDAGPAANGVVGILQELTQVHAFAAVEMVAEQADDAPEVDRELVAHGVVLACRGGTRTTGVDGAAPGP